LTVNAQSGGGAGWSLDRKRKEEREKEKKEEKESLRRILNSFSFHITWRERGKEKRGKREVSKAP